MTNELTQGIKKRAVEWAKKITRIANKNLGKQRTIISVKTTVEERDGLVETRTVGKGAAARAYEYGSGVHSRISKRSPKQLGVKGKILIKPVNKKVLAFNWEVANTTPGYWIFGDDGNVLLPSVKHPGVRASNGGKGYIQPAINEVRKDIRKELPKETRDAVLGTFRKAFKK